MVCPTLSWGNISKNVRRITSSAPSRKLLSGPFGRLVSQFAAVSKKPVTAWPMIATGLASAGGTVTVGVVVTTAAAGRGSVGTVGMAAAADGGVTVATRVSGPGTVSAEALLRGIETVAAAG